MDQRGRAGAGFHDRPFDRIDKSGDLDAPTVVTDWFPAVPAHVFHDTLQHLRISAQTGDEATSHRTTELRESQEEPACAAGTAALKRREAPALRD